MSLFGSLMSGFDDDPFFGGHRGIMRQMDQMMTSMMRDPFEDDPFFGNGGAGGGGGGGVFPALTAGPGAAGGAISNALATRPPHHHHHHRPRHTAPPPPPPPTHPFSALGFPSIANMMTTMNPMGQEAHMFSSSSVMTMTTGPDGRPQVYQASSSTTGVPGGVRETRRTESDSRTGLRKMAIGHHIGQRSHIIEREHSNNNAEERQEFINLEEEEAAQFDHEFRRRTHHAMGGRSLEYRPRHRNSAPSSYNPRVSSVPAITSSGSRYRSRSRPALSITAGPSEDRARRRDREERGQRSQRRNM